MTERDIGEFVYRGTTLGWPGSPTTLGFESCSASTDPVAATLFAIQCRNVGGPAVLHLIEVATAELTDDRNVLWDLEREVVVARTASEAEELAVVTVPVEDAVDALRRFGIELPVRISPFGDALNASLLEHRRLDDVERRQFDSLLLTG